MLNFRKKGSQIVVDGSPLECPDVLRALSPSVVTCHMRGDHAIARAAQKEHAAHILTLCACLRIPRFVVDDRSDLQMLDYLAWSLRAQGFSQEKVFGAGWASYSQGPPRNGPGVAIGIPDPDDVQASVVFSPSAFLTLVGPSQQIVSQPSGFSRLSEVRF
jgi:hypothetical protein